MLAKVVEVICGTDVASEKSTIYNEVQPLKASFRDVDVVDDNLGSLTSVKDVQFLNAPSSELAPVQEDRYGKFTTYMLVFPLNASKN